MRARVCVGTECSHGGAGGTNGSRCGGAVYRRKHGTGRASRAARHTSCGVVKNNEGMRKQNSVVSVSTDDTQLSTDSNNVEV